MTQIAGVYGEALFSLAREEDLDQVIGEQLNIIDDCFRQEPDYLRLLDAPNLLKTERCQILDDCFRGKVHPYVLNFLKILTEKGYIRHFSGCVEAYTDLFNQAHGILPVTAVTAISLTAEQAAKLTEKLHSITGKRIALTNRLDPTILGGMRLDYDGKRVDDTVAHRMDAVRTMLKNTVL